MNRSGICLVRVKGAFLDAGNRDRFLSSLRARTAGYTKVVLDLGRLQFIDSSGVGSLLTLAKEFRSAGGEIIIANPAPAVQQTFSMVYLHHKMPVCDTVERAMVQFDELSAAVRGKAAEEQVQ